jgi:DNA polymerase III subunit beta
VVKFQVERDVLAEAVAWTARALPARPALPVLAGMRLLARRDGAAGHQGQELTLSSFDYDVSAQASLPVTVEEEGSVLVPGRLLTEITRSLPPRRVEVRVDASRTIVTCGSAQFSLLMLPEEDYPALPEMPPSIGTVESDVFAAAVAQVATAAGRDDTLPALTGVRVEIERDTLTLVATDRYRLAVRELRWNPAQPELSAAVLVPGKALSDTARALTSGAEVSIALALPGESGDGMIGFEGSGRRATTRLLGGEFPRYQALLPEHVNATAELPAALLSESVKRVALVAERNTPVRLSFSAGQLLLEAGTGDEAQAAETLEANYEGEDTQIAFNPQYLLDGLTAMDSDTIRISFTAPAKPAVITGKPEADQAPACRYLLMPIRLSG